MTMSGDHLVDVLVPVFNAERTVESALASILAQTMRSVRVIVVDDGSTDGTPEILSRMKAQDERIVVLTRDNSGIVDALNAGLALCTAPYVARHDADDLAYPDRLERQYHYMALHHDCVALGANAHHIDNEGKRTGYTTTFGDPVVGDPCYYPSREPYLLHPFLFVRRAALLSVGGYRHAFHSEDTDLYWRLAAVGRLVNLSEVLGEYRVHAASISSSSTLNGRIAAVNAQLAAISYRRRQSAHVDIDFPRHRIDEYRAADKLREVLNVATRGLDAVERSYVATATAAKLIELSTYRPYRLTRDDVLTLRTILSEHYRAIPRKNRLYIVFRLILGSKRRSGSLSDALALVPRARLGTMLLDVIGEAFVKLH